MRTLLATLASTALLLTAPAVGAQTPEDPPGMPEDGGELPRAGAVGGVDDGLPRSGTPEGGTPTDWRTRPTPPDETPAKPAAEDPAHPAPTGVKSTKRESAQFAAPALNDFRQKLVFQWDGYLRVLGQVIENDALPFIGRVDGFRLGNARLGLRVKYDTDLQAYVSVEAAAQRSSGANDPNATLSVELRDAFFLYDLADPVTLQVGRFKPPYDLGQIEAVAYRVFIDAPVESRGVPRTQGIELPGLGLDRQLGVMLQKAHLGLSKDGFDLGYALALTNGETRRLAFNDNDRPAGHARLTAYWGDLVQLNLAGYLDRRTSGELPNLFDEDVIGAEASLIVAFAGLRIEGQLLFQRTVFDTTGVEAINAIGWHAQWSYRFWEMELGYRFGWYDPNDRFDADKVMEHTLGLSYFPSGAPLRFAVNGTFADEDRDVDNNRLDFMAQFIF